jgi:hypothetical protein
MNKFLILIALFVLFMVVGIEVTALTVHDNPNVKKEDIPYIMECADTLVRGIDAIPYIISGRHQAVEEQFGKSAIVKYYTLYKIPSITVLVEGSGCKRI